MTRGSELPLLQEILAQKRGGPLLDQDLPGPIFDCQVAPAGQEEPESIPWPGGPWGGGGDGQGGHLLGEVIGLLSLLVEGLSIADEEGQQLADFLAQG